LKQQATSYHAQGRVRTHIYNTMSKLGFTNLPFQIYVLLIISLLFSIGRNIAFPYLAMYLTGDKTLRGLEIDPTLVGFMIMVGGLANIFALPATGSLCDRFGRRKMMLSFMIPQIVLTAGYAYASKFQEFLLLYVIMGIMSAFYDPAYSSMVADLVQPNRREEVYGLSYMIANIGTIISPLIGGVVASTNGYAILFIYATIFTAICAAIILLLIKESYPKEESKKTTMSQFAKIFKDRIFILFCLTGALTNIVYSQLYGLLSIYTEYVGLQPYVFGTLFSVNGAMVVALQIPIRKAAVKIGSTKSFVIAQLLYAAGFTYFMLSKDFLQFLIGVIVLTLGEITFFPASSGFIADLSPADMRGRYMALTGLFFGIGGSVGSLIGFRLYATLLKKELTWGILGAIGFATMPGYLYLLKADKRKARNSAVDTPKIK